ncbi:MAG TPA: hypothetical protein VHZ07_08470 [Bryobacteraceae bacterium]|jgi:hypothetical protein|nr:hypothetical protein [Bryobacteraceae bacterium]
MRTYWKSAFAVCTLAAPLFAGALLLQVGNPAANPEALEKHAVLVARTTACHSPERTTVTATAEGVVNGVRKTIPLKVIPLSTAGTFAVTREWPNQGTWAVKMIATNPDYKDYATAVVVPIERDLGQLGAVKHYFHAPTEAEVSSSLN